MTDIEQERALPALPEPGWIYIDTARNNARVSCFTAAQMHAYGRQCAEQARAQQPSASPARNVLRNLIDAAWNAATESEEVPSTPWADQIIDKVLTGMPQVPAAQPDEFELKILRAENARQHAVILENEQLRARIAELEAQQSSATGAEAACTYIGFNNASGHIFRWEVAPMKSGTKLYTSPAADVLADAARYQVIRRGQHWSVINGIGDELRGNALDAAIDATRAKGGE